jgi:L-ascorbate metabolism protein UlaG (beta-lactamase superfamily)
MKMSLKITWLGHASVRVNDGSSNIYFDPWNLSGNLPPADIIIVTHEHHDHYSEPDIRMVSKPGMKVVAPMKTELVSDVVKPGERILINGIEIMAVPAYNIGKAFHPKSNDWAGFVVTMDGKRIYHSGDTDRIPEMKSIKTDIAFLSSGGTYTMTSKEAASAVLDVGAKIAIPIHWGDIVGSIEDAREFERLSGCEVRLLKRNETITLD